MVNYINALATITTIIGSAMALSYFFQIAKILKTKSVKDLSLAMFSVFSIGLTLWLIYGIAIKSWPLIIVNAISVIGVYITLFLILKFRK
ncbi:MAG: SemiSWEET family transporter [Nanoarchaeota archaeon]